MTGDVRVLSRLIDELTEPGEVPPSMSGSSEEAAPGDVSDGDLSILLSAARVAPSADNAQIWRFVTVRDEAGRRALGDACAEKLGGAFAAAKVVIVACGVRFIVTRTRKEQPFSMVDVPIALLHVLLQAADLGLSTCWTLEPREAEVRELLGIPGDVRVVAMAAVAPGDA